MSECETEYNSVDTIQFVTGSYETLEATYLTPDFLYGDAVTQAELLIKDNPDKSDSEAVIHKTITAVEGLSGYVRYSGNTSGYIDLFFYLTEADTSAIQPGIRYRFFTRITTASGKKHVMQVGNVYSIKGA